MCNRLLKFFQSQDLLSKHQHGFIRGRSIETAVFNFVEQIIKNIENKQLTMGIFLDLSRAYDCLDHNILLNKLVLYGIRGVPLQWIRSYLSDRTQKVTIEKDCETYISNERRIRVGIPQGSVAGPLLFIIFVNDLSHALTNQNTNLVSYADDTNLLVCGNSHGNIIYNKNVALTNITEWFSRNKLILNENKTKYVQFQTKQANLDLSEIIKLNDNTKFLGIYIDKNLTWSDEIQYICKKLNGVNYTLRVLKQYTNSEVLKTIYYANFQSILRYGIMFWGNCSDINDVFVIQKRTIRTILNLGYRESCRGKFKEIGVLTVTGIYIYECLLFLNKNKEIFDDYKHVHNYQTRTLNYNFPKHRLTLTEKSPVYSCIKFYNILPDEIKNSANFRCFKKAIYIYLLEMEPYSVREYMQYSN